MAPEGSTIDQPAVETPSAQPAQPASPAPGNAPQAPSQPAAKWEDDPRAKGILADLQRERRARQDYERKVAEHETRLAERERQIAALTNSKPPSKEEADAEAVRERFAQLFPHLGAITPELIEQIQALAAQGEQMNASVEHQWTQYGRQTLSNVYQEISKEIGDLSDRQRKRINAAFIQEAESDPNFLSRYEAGDPTLIKEFVKGYLDDVIEPVRRKMTQTEVNRARPVPFGKDRSIPGEPDRKIDVNDPKAVMDFIMESRKDKFPHRR